MYEQVSHSLLNAILDDLKPEISRQDLRHFYTRLGANFYAIYSLFFNLYGQRKDFKPQMLRLVETMAKGYINRSAELEAPTSSANWIITGSCRRNGSAWRFIPTVSRTAWLI